MAFGLFLAIVVGLLGWTWIRNQPAPQRNATLAKMALVLGVIGLVFLALTGRLHIVGIVLAMAYPFLRRFLPGLMQQAKTAGSQGNRSSVTSDILEMSLDHDTGAMYGKVLRGPMEGRMLEQLEEHEFIELLRYCRREDGNSARLLETYLDKRFGDSWREDDDPQNTDSGNTGDRRDERQAQRSEEMSREEAYEILGLEPGASHEDISQAHRRLMQRLHPDRGGSAYLAARINAARKLLLD